MSGRLAALAAAGQRRAVVVAAPPWLWSWSVPIGSPLCQLGGSTPPGYLPWSMAPAAPAEPSGRVRSSRSGRHPSRRGLDAARAARPVTWSSSATVPQPQPPAWPAWPPGTGLGHPGFAPAAWARPWPRCSPPEADRGAPASPDGRPRPRVALGSAARCWPGRCRCTTTWSPPACIGGSVLAEHLVADPVVVTVQPGPGSTGRRAAPRVETIEPTPVDGTRTARSSSRVPPSRRDHHGPGRGASRILGGGAGLDSAERFDRLTEGGDRLGASMGATRVVTDRGWVPQPPDRHDRRGGRPRSVPGVRHLGAVQHTAGSATRTSSASTPTRTAR